MMGEYLNFCHKLSQLKTGDSFRFKGDQTALYMVNGGRSQKHDTQEHIEYFVIQKNKTSLKVRSKLGDIEYTFKFKGWFAGYENEGVDSIVSIIT